MATNASPAGVAGLAAGRKRVSKPRARTGCGTCRAAHVRCDEGRPVCHRCARLRLVCDYNYVRPGRRAPGRGEVVLRRLAPSIPSCPLHASLSPSATGFLDYFQAVVVPLLCRQPDGPSDFWSQTVLRDCTRDRGVVDAVVAIAALFRARSSASHSLPHHNLQGCHLASSAEHDSYYQAVQHYTRAVAGFRERLAGGHRHTSMVLAPRTVVIFTVLFSMFEILQGHTAAFDQLVSNGLRLLSTQWRRRVPASRAGPGPHPGGVDEPEIHDAECFLARTATWSALFSPMYPRSRLAMASMAGPYELGAPPPDRRTSSVQDLWRGWWRFVTMAVDWHLRIHSLRASTACQQWGVVQSTLKMEQTLVLERTDAWAKEAQARLLAAAPAPHVHHKHGRDRHLLAMLVFEIKICYWSGYHALDVSGDAWRERAAECLQILDMAQLAIDELTSAGGTGYDSVVSDGLLIGLLQLARECRDQVVRPRALALARRLVKPDSSWHVKSLLLGVWACATVEDRGCDGTTRDGAVPERYEWTEGSWDHDFTALHVAVTSRNQDEHGYRRRETMIINLKAWDLA